MNLQQMIEVLQAAERGEKIEWRSNEGTTWNKGRPEWNFGVCEYRIAPKKEMTLVEELRSWDDPHGIKRRAADRIEELEKSLYNPAVWHTDELLDEIKRRIEK